MYEGIIKNIGLNLDINAKRRVEGGIDVKLYSKDIGTGVFEFTFLNENEQKIKIDNTYSSRVMLKTDYDDSVYITNIDIIGGIARFVFPHRFITQSGTVTLYLYLTKNDKTSDVAAISFNVYRSEIDDVATDVITTYDKNYEDILANFEEYINISKDEWKALVKETSDFVKEIENITLDEFISQKIDEKYNNIEQNYITNLEANEAKISAWQVQEEARVTAEGKRVESEAEREANEQTRINKDRSRDDKIAQMEEAEVDRQEAEVDRQAQEEARGEMFDVKEAERQAEFNASELERDRQTSLLNDATGTRLKYWAGSQAQYDAIGTYDLDTVYDIW